MKDLYNKYNNLLLTKFPILKKDFEDYTEWQEGINTGSLVVYEDIFVPYIINQLVNENKVEIEKIVSFIEELLDSNDEYAFNIAYVAILETLKSDPNGQKIEKYLKSHGLKEYKELVY